MKIKVFINASPLHRIIIKNFIKINYNDEYINIILHCRGENEIIENAENYYFKDENFLFSINFIKKIYSHIEKIQGHKFNKNNKFDIYTPHGNYLLVRMHRLIQLGRIYYIEDGLGTHAYIYDLMNGCKLLEYSMSVDIAVEKKKIINNKKNSRIYRDIEKKIFKFNRSFAIFIEKQISRISDNYFNFIGESFGGLILLQRIKNIDYTISSGWCKPKRQKKNRRGVLILMPPLGNILKEHLNFFIEFVVNSINRNNQGEIYIKPHPVNTTNQIFELMKPYNLPLNFIETLNDESVIWGYSNGLEKVYCWDSSGFLINKLYLKDDSYTVEDVSHYCESYRSVSKILFKHYKPIISEY